MEGQVVLLDSSVLIDYFRKPNKEKTFLIALIDSGHTFRISAVTVFEVYAGAPDTQLGFWTGVLKGVEVIPFGPREAMRAAALVKEMKANRKQLASPDLFIAATAIEAGLPVATLDRRHFGYVPGVVLVEG